MKCPACKEVLVAVELDGVEVDLCDGCKGIWLDRGELELLYAGPRDAEDFIAGLKAAPATGEKPRRCPICDARMVKVGGAWEPAVRLDECPTKDGLWFDRGELIKVLHAHGSSDKVQNFLTGIFGTQ